MTTIALTESESFGAKPKKIDESVELTNGLRYLILYDVVSKITRSGGESRQNQQSSEPRRVLKGEI